MYYNANNSSKTLKNIVVVKNFQWFKSMFPKKVYADSHLRHYTLLISDTIYAYNAHR